MKLILHPIMSAAYNHDIYLLEQFQKLITELNSTEGTNAKIDTFKKYGDIKHIIIKFLNKDKTHVTESGLIKYQSTKLGRISPESGLGLISLYDALVAETLSGDKAKETIWALAKKYEPHTKLVVDIMSKNVRIRMGTKTIEKAFPGSFIPFQTMLATETKDVSDVKNAYISDKKDGVRVLTFIEGGIVKATVSRKNKPFTSLAVLVKAINSMEIKGDWVLDGEVVGRDAEGKELPFQETVSQARTKDEAMPNPLYLLFGMIPKTAWDAQHSTEIFDVELARLKALPPTPHIAIFPQIPFTQESFAAEVKRAKEQKIEGLMIRLNKPWEAKRSKHLLKYKFMEDAEFKVKDVTIINMQFPNSTGGEETIRAVKNLLIEYKGDPVWVGSGLSKSQRLEWAINPDLIIGKTITVQYQEEFRDASTGKMSLRIPTLKDVHGKTRTD